MFNKRILRIPILFSVLISFLFISVLLASGQRRGEKTEGKPPILKAEIQLYKKQYLISEPIWVNCRVTNIGDKAGKFYFENVDALIITDSKGITYQCSTAIERVPITIKPGQVLEKESDILWSYGIPENKFKGHRYLPLGKYNICYELNHSVGSEAYKIYTKSQVDSFQVLEAQGDELKALNLLRESHNSFINKNTEMAINELNQLIKDFPKSIYVPVCLLEEVSLYRIDLEDFNTAESLCYDLIRNYPISREAVRAVEEVSAIYQIKKEKNGFLNSMNDLIRKYPDSDISKEAEKQIRQVNDKDFK